MGEVIDLSLVKDEDFATEVIDKGVAIIPSEGRIYSPVDGIVTAMFYTNHAVGMISDKGEEILIHVGMNTVQLEGKHFTPKVKTRGKSEKGITFIKF